MPRDTQIGEDAHRYAHRIGATVFFVPAKHRFEPSQAWRLPLDSQGTAEAGLKYKVMLALGGVRLHKLWTE